MMVHQLYDTVELNMIIILTLYIKGVNRAVESLSLQYF